MKMTLKGGRAVVVLLASACFGLTQLAKADGTAGAVYAMTNASVTNQILVYQRAANGLLSPTPFQTVATGGGGSGPLTFSADNTYTLSRP